MLLSKPELVKLAVEVAHEYNLDPALVCAHIDIRSQWNSGFSLPTAVSYLVHQNFPDPMECEWRSVQWGLMGILGEFARNEGYQGKLSELLAPDRNLQEGCRILKRLMGSDPDYQKAAVEALVKWNRESSQNFAALVLSKLEAYRVLLVRIPDQQQTFQCDDTIHPQERLQIEGNLLLEVGASTHTQSLP